MRYRYVTQKRNGEHWIVGIRLVAEHDSPRRPLDCTKPPRINLFDGRQRPLYIFTPDGPEYRGRPQHEIDADLAEARAIEAREYLDSTDWYVIREVETGKPMPDDVRIKREEARNAIET